MIHINKSKFSRSILKNRHVLSVKGKMIVRQIFVIIFLVAGVFWQLDPAYACPMHDSVTLAQFCCTSNAMQEKCASTDRCANEQICNARPYCASINTSQFIYKDMGVQTKHGNLPDVPAHSANDLLAYMFGPGDSDIKQYLWTVDSPWLFGTATYLMTDRLRI